MGRLVPLFITVLLLSSCVISFAKEERVERKHKKKFSQPDVKDENKKIEQFAKEGDLKMWDEAVTENVHATSHESACEDQEKCRSWREILDVANCKAGLWEQMHLEETQSHLSLFYAETTYKVEGEGEWAKFIYTAIPPKKTGDALDKRGPTKYVRVCVPVDTDKLGWVDHYCPLLPCGPRPDVVECDKKEYAEKWNQGVEAKPKDVLQKVEQKGAVGSHVGVDYDESGKAQNTQPSKKPVNEVLLEIDDEFQMLERISRAKLRRVRDIAPAGCYKQ